MSSVSPVSPAPRRVRSPSWFDLRLVFGIALVLVSIAGGALVLSRADSTKPVVAVNRDLAAGTVLKESDLRTVRLRITGSSAVYVDKNSDAVGKTLQRDLGNGDLVPVSALGDVATDQTTLSIPVDSDGAPTLERGQRISVRVSNQYCSSVVVLADVTVQDVQKPGTGALSATSGQGVVVQIPTALANRVFSALGLSQVTVRIGITSGPVDPDANSTAKLGDLSTCLAPAKSS